MIIFTAWYHKINTKAKNTLIFTMVVNLHTLRLVASFKRNLWKFNLPLLLTRRVLKTPPPLLLWSNIHPSMFRKWFMFFPKVNDFIPEIELTYLFANTMVLKNKIVVTVVPQTLQIPQSDQNYYFITTTNWLLLS